MATTMKQVLSDNIQNLLSNEFGDHVWVQYAQHLLNCMENDGSGGDFDDCFLTTKYLHKNYNFNSDSPLSMARIKNILSILQELGLISFVTGAGLDEETGIFYPDEWVKNSELAWQ